MKYPVNSGETFKTNNRKKKYKKNYPKKTLHKERGKFPKTYLSVKKINNY
jgi:hypothetical protein